MRTNTFAICTIVAALLALAGCATSPEDEQRRMEMEADIDEILSYELDPAEYGEPEACLHESKYRSYHALGKRHLLFRGRQGKLWVNVLRGRCSFLDDDSVFVIEPNVGGQLCDRDQFKLIDRFEPLSRANTSPICVLGKFKPVTEAQVREIEGRLDTG